MDLTQFIIQFIVRPLKVWNDFKITEMYWFRDPRYSKDLKLIKCNDIIHYMLNRKEYVDADITINYGDKKYMTEILMK